MLFTFFYYILSIILFIFLQNLFAEITIHAIFISITIIFTMSQVLSDKKYLIFVGVYGLFFDIIFTKTFGLYFVVFISIAFLFKFLIKNILNSVNMSIFGTIALMFGGVFLVTLVHDLIVENIIDFYRDIVIIFMCSLFAIFEFLIFKKMLEFSEKVSNRLSSANSKKHV